MPTGMSDTLLIVIVTALVNGAVVWGALRVELRWLRRDVDRAQSTADAAHRRLDRVPVGPAATD